VETVIILLLLFSIKHFLADFVFQSNTMVQEKGTYGAMGGLQHAFTHAMLTAFLLLPVIPVVMVVLKIAFIDGIIHYHIDWIKQKASKGYTPADKAFWFWLGLDQMLHYITYLVITAWVVITI
jgi:hypothetical protein